MSDLAAENGARLCVECDTATDRWVRGWDGKYRCVDHAALGPPNERLTAHHCPTCRCPIPPAKPRCHCGAYPVSPDHCLTLFDRNDAAVERHAGGACERGWRAVSAEPGQRPCGSCGATPTYTIILHGRPVPACLRHLNHWRTPAPDYTCPTACVEQNHPGREHDSWLTGHVPAPSQTISGSTGLVYCKACGYLLFSDSKGRTAKADQPCTPVRIGLRAEADQ